MDKHELFFLQHQSDLLELYRAYDIVNIVCWNGKLPSAILMFNKRNNTVLASARPISADYYGAEIRFNLYHWEIDAGDEDDAVYCDILEEDFIHTLIHEMIHIWQFFFAPQTPWHGKEFKKEGERIGYITDKDIILPNTLAEQAQKIIYKKNISYSRILDDWARVSWYKYDTRRSFFEFSKKLLAYKSSQPLQFIENGYQVSHLNKETCL